MVVLAGTGSGLVDVATGTVVELGGSDVRAVDGDWVLLDGREVTRRGDPGGPFSNVAPAGLPLTCIAAVPDGHVTVLVGTAGGHLLLFRGGAALERSAGFDQADGREEWYTPWGAPADVRSASANDDGTMLVNVHVGGILRSTDHGVSWRPTIDLHTDVHQVIALGAGRAVAACAMGLATSDDDGTTWTLHDAGLHATYARAAAVAGDMVLLSVSDGPGGARSAIYRRPLDGSRPLERCSAGLPDDLGGNVDTGWLAGGPDGTAAFVTASGQVFGSDDAGGRWRRLGSVAESRCVTLG
jgi:hypothetical protein